MGKATIKSGGTDGLYIIDIEYDNQRASARLEIINEQITKLQDDELPSAFQKALESEQSMYEKLQALKDYILQIKLGNIDLDPLTSGNLSAEALQSRTIYELDKRAYYSLVLRWNALKKERDKLEDKSKNTQEVQAWCADYTEDLTGTVATIEAGYEKDFYPIIIRPGYESGADYDIERDGQLTNFFNQSAHQLYTNRAYLPALAKWQPRYRTGTITSINISTDTCNVNLNPLLSSQQSINLNQTESLENVPVQYMDCNASVFEVGDGVVVGFNYEWDERAVIGFSSEPRPCKLDGIWLFPVSALSPTGWGRPFIDDEGELINPPLGTPGGTNPYVRVRSKNPGELSLQRGVPLPNAGNVDWTGGGIVLSFNGPPSRSCPPLASETIDPSLANELGYNTVIGDQLIHINWGHSVYTGGKILATFSSYVLGAGVATFANDLGETARILIVVVMTNEQSDEVFYAPFSSDRPITVFESAGDIVYPSNDMTAFHRDHPFHFSVSGRKAVTIYKNRLADGYGLNSQLELFFSYSGGVLSFSPVYTYNTPVYASGFFNYVLENEGLSEFDRVISASQGSQLDGGSVDMFLAADYKGEIVETLKLRCNYANFDYTEGWENTYVLTRSSSFSLVIGNQVVDTFHSTKTYATPTSSAPAIDELVQSYYFISYCDLRYDKLIWLRRTVQRDSINTAPVWRYLRGAREGYDVSVGYIYTISEKLEVYDSGLSTVLHDETNGPYPSDASRNYVVEVYSYPPLAPTSTSFTFDMNERVFSSRAGSGIYNDQINFHLGQLRRINAFSQTLDGVLISNIDFQIGGYYYSGFGTPGADPGPFGAAGSVFIPTNPRKNYVYISGKDPEEFLSVSGERWGISGPNYGFKLLKV
jgi:hypothetical protein